MEYKAVVVVFLVALLASISVFVYWLRRKSGFSNARQEYGQFLKEHLATETLIEQLEAIANGTFTVHQPKRSWWLYLQVAGAMVLAVAVIFVVARFTSAGLVIRAIVGILALLPFLYYISVGIAEEYDDNRIFSFERVTSRQLLEKSEKEPIAGDIDELLG